VFAAIVTVFMFSGSLTSVLIPKKKSNETPAKAPNNVSVDSVIAAKKNTVHEQLLVDIVMLGQLIESNQQKRIGLGDDQKMCEELLEDLLADPPDEQDREQIETIRSFRIDIINEQLTLITENEKLNTELDVFNALYERSQINGGNNTNLNTRNGGKRASSTLTKTNHLHPTNSNSSTEFSHPNNIFKKGGVCRRGATAKQDGKNTYPELFANTLDSIKKTRKNGVRFLSNNMRLNKLKISKKKHKRKSKNVRKPKNTRKTKKQKTTRNGTKT